MVIMSEVLAVPVTILFSHLGRGKNETPAKKHSCYLYIKAMCF